MDKNLELAEVAKYLHQLVSIEVIKLLKSEDIKPKSNSEKIVLLDTVGLNVDEIAFFVGTTPGTVRKELSVNKSKRNSG